MVPKALVSASTKPIILSILAEGENYGYQIIQRIRDISSGQIEWTTGTLYPLLHSLENEGLLVSNWQTAENAPRRKYYRLTPAGHAALEQEKRHWIGVTQMLLNLWGPQPGLSFV
jgi:DNA-binding PadR family transcriptional regulator